MLDNLAVRNPVDVGHGYAWRGAVWAAMKMDYCIRRINYHPLDREDRTGLAEQRLEHCQGGVWAICEVGIVLNIVRSDVELERCARLALVVEQLNEVLDHGAHFPAHALVSSLGSA
jgi:hypothetical protein